MSAVAARMHRRSGEVHARIVNPARYAGRPERSPAFVGMVHEYGAPEKNIAETAWDEARQFGSG